MMKRGRFLRISRMAMALAITVGLALPSRILAADMVAVSGSPLTKTYTADLDREFLDGGYPRSYDMSWADTDTVSGAKDIVDTVTTEGMTEMQKAEAIATYFVNNSVFDREITNSGITDYSNCESWHARGAILNHKAICNGFAEAYQLCMEQAGIMAFSLCTESHAWNAVLIDGTIHEVDITWDISSGAGRAVIRTPEQMLRFHLGEG